MTSQFEELYGASAFLHEESIDDCEEYLDSLLAVLEEKTKNQRPSLVHEECPDVSSAPSSSGKKCAGRIKLKR
jgi:hypothetical protein